MSIFLSDDFLAKLDEFKNDSQTYINSMTFEARFNEFRKLFEAAFSLNLRELDNSGMFEVFINIPLYEDVKNEMVKLLKEKGFNETSPGHMNNIFDFYFENNKNRTYFCVLKHKKVYNKLA